MGRYAEEIKAVLAKEAETRIHAHLGEVLKNPTGFYESNIHSERQVNDVMVTDTPVVYGPWLEGVGSRNQSTRFKGYHTFRIVSQQLDMDAMGIVNPLALKYVLEANI